jgi:hypothetical protein
LAGTDSIIVSDIFIEHLDEHIVTNVLNFDVVSLVPFGRLSCVLLHGCLECLLPVVDNAERVHLSEELRVAGQTRLNNSETKLS